jgi:hypothetical protein
MEPISMKVEALMRSQLKEWEQAANNYSALSGVRVKEIPLGNMRIKVQFNPARIVSSAAKVDAKSISERKCFLCKENRPAVQKGIEYCGKAGNYEILVNPFPIFPKHLTIPETRHTRQQIEGRYFDMLNLSQCLSDYVIFYNGPKCGASAPDHMHFQAGNKGMLPIQTATGSLHLRKIDFLCNGSSCEGVNLYEIKDFIRGAFLIVSGSVEASEVLFERIYNLLLVKEGEWEPMLNILSWYQDNKWYTALFIREKHRPSHYFAQGDANILLSPASVDLGGVFITPLEKDFHKITGREIVEICDEIMVPQVVIDNLILKLKQ